MIGEAIHLVSSESAAGHVKEATRPLGIPRHVRILGDRLTIGPCDADPVRHAELRRAWSVDGLNRACSLDDLRAAVSGDMPIIVWASRAYDDMVWMWWVLDSLAWLGRSATIVRLESRRESVGGLPPEDGRAAMRSAHTISDEEFRDAYTLWRLFTLSDPRPFDEVRRSELHDSAEPHGAWFARFENGRLGLSENDERLLAILTDQFRTPGDINRRVIKSGEWERVLWVFGGFAHIRRLREWAAHGVIEREHRDPGNDNPFERDAFCISDRARILLTHGLESVGDAPSLYVGGCKLNDPDMPWVRVADEEGWMVMAGAP